VTKLGPNDASRVVWAIGKFFLFSSCFFTNILYIGSIFLFKEIREIKEASDGKNWPRRRQTTLSKCFSFFFVFFFTTNYVIYYI
jgi:Ca2+/Na+ antiporter